MRRLGRLAAWTALALVPLVGACDSGPEGPGTLSARVTSPSPLGAVILEVTGAAVEGFQGQGDTQAYGATVSATQGLHRVVLVDRSGDGTIHFGIEVSDLAADPPLITVVKVATPTNLITLSTGVEVHIE